VVVVALVCLYEGAIVTVASTPLAQAPRGVLRAITCHKRGACTRERRVLFKAFDISIDVNDFGLRLFGGAFLIC